MWGSIGQTGSSVPNVAYWAQGQVASYPGYSTQGAAAMGWDQGPGWDQSSTNHIPLGSNGIGRGTSVMGTTAPQGARSSFEGAVGLSAAGHVPVSANSSRSELVDMLAEVASKMQASGTSVDALGPLLRAATEPAVIQFRHDIWSCKCSLEWRHPDIGDTSGYMYHLDVNSGGDTQTVTLPGCRTSSVIMTDPGQKFVIELRAVSLTNGSVLAMGRTEFQAGNLSGLFFSARPGLMKTSPFGDKCLFIEPERLLDGRSTNLYFADFYCTGSGGNHHVTLIAVDSRRREIVAYCDRVLYPMNISSNSFFSCSVENSTRREHYFVATSVWVEIFFLGDVKISLGDIGNILPTKGANYFLQRPEGLLGNQNCKICNLPANDPVYTMSAEEWQSNRPAVTLPPAQSLPARGKAPPAQTKSSSKADKASPSKAKAPPPQPTPHQNSSSINSASSIDNVARWVKSTSSPNPFYNYYSANTTTYKMVSALETEELIKSGKSQEDAALLIDTDQELVAVRETVLKLVGATVMEIAQDHWTPIYRKNVLSQKMKGKYKWVLHFVAQLLVQNPNATWAEIGQAVSTGGLDVELPTSGAEPPPPPGRKAKRKWARVMEEVREIFIDLVSPRKYDLGIMIAGFEKGRYKRKRQEGTDQGEIAKESGNTGRSTIKPANASDEKKFSERLVSSSTSDVRKELVGIPLAESAEFSQLNSKGKRNMIRKMNRAKAGLEPDVQGIQKDAPPEKRARLDVKAESRSAASERSPGTKPMVLSRQDRELVVFLASDPDYKLNAHQAELLRESIVEKLRECDMNPLPRFESSGIVSGTFTVVWVDASSRDWLLDVVPRLVPPWPGARFQVSSREDHSNGRNIVITQPDGGPIGDTSKMFNRLAKQNPGLTTDKWIVLRKLNDSGSSLLVRVDRTSLEVLQSVNMKPYYQLSRLDCRLHSAGGK